MSGRGPLLSVVIPYVGGKLTHLVRSLMLQTLGSRSFEVIIVYEDGCDADFDALAGSGLDITLLSYARPAGFTGHSAGPMRNVGIRQAEADRIAFIDSDCLLGPQCLSRHVMPDNVGRTAICGLARELPATAAASQLYTHEHDALWVLAARDWREEASNRTGVGSAATWREFYTCNASAPRALLIKAGLFDEQGYRCHDLDLGYRLHLAGCRFELDADCEVIHLEHPRSARFRQDQINGWGWLAAKHPELAHLAQDKTVTLQRAERRAVESAEARFRTITRGQPGLRCASTWVFPEGTTLDSVRDGLRNIPFVHTACRGSAELFLRLEKNCWDFSFLLPAVVDKPQATIVVPAYNAERTIGRAIESALRQSDQSFELIIVDDGSTDHTLRALTPYYSSKRLRVLANGENRGLAHCLNRALDACHGTYLLQLDADDWLEPHALERLLAIFAKDPDLSAIYGAPRVHGRNAAGQTTQRIEGGFQVSTPADCLTYSYFQAPRIYRVETLKSVGGWKVDDGYSGRYFEDRMMLATGAQHSAIHYCAEPLYNVVEERTSLSRREPLRAASAKLAILQNHACLHGQTLTHAFNGGLLSAKRFGVADSAEPTSWSVILPFAGSLELLVLTLKSWLESDLRSRLGELIVVVDGKDATVGGPLPSSPLIRVITRDERGGPAAARNIGAAASNNEWLFFSDADRIVPPNVLSLHESRHATTNRRALVIGDVFGRRTFTMVPPALSPARKRRLLELLRFRNEFEAAADQLLRGEVAHLVPPTSAGIWSRAQRYAFTESWPVRWGEFLLQYGDDLKYFPHKWLRVGTGSLSMSRETFFALGGFDEAFRAMEDWDFGIRSQEADYEIICAPEAEPLHQVHTVETSRLLAEVDGKARLIAKHPVAIERLNRTSPGLVPPGGEQFLTLGMDYGRAKSEEWNELRDTRVGGEMVLTFDDGPNEHYSNLILDSLEATNARGVFFVLGSKVKQHDRIVRRLVRDGHEVGIHGWHHQNWSHLTCEELQLEISRTLRLIEDVSGRQVRYVRPPYGILPAHALSTCGDLGLTAVGWTLSSRDWQGLSEAEMKIELACNSPGGHVLLFHDGYGNPGATASALQWFIPACAVAGVRPATLDEYLMRYGPLPCR